jgi:hypothetical protein
MECGGIVFQKYGVNQEKIFCIYIWLLVDIILEDQEVQRKAWL